MNEALLLGNLTADPDSRSLSNGSKVVSFRMATNETWRDKQTGERKSRAEFHSVVISNEGLGKVAEQYLRKGSKVLIRGQIQTRKWEKDGIDRYTTEIVLKNYSGELVLLGSKDGDGGDRSDRQDDRGSDSSGSSRSSQSNSSSGGGGFGGGGFAGSEEEIPFAPEWR